MKKMALPALIVTILVQLMVPAYMIYGKYDILRTGDEYRFSVMPVDPYDAFRGRYVRLNSPQQVWGSGKYGVIDVGPDGFAYVAEITDAKPVGKPYVTSDSRNWFRLPIDRYYMAEHLAPRAETYVADMDRDRAAYVTVRIKNGSLVISGLYVDGVPIEEIVKSIQ